MRPAAAIALAATLVACSGSSAPGPTPAQLAPSGLAELSAHYGSYRTDTGDTLVVARLGWFFDMETSAYRTIYVQHAPDDFAIGCRFGEPSPKCADLKFTAGTLTVTDSAHKTTVAHRVEYAQTDVTIPAAGAQLAGTITETGGSARRGGIVIVHGSEPGERFFYDIWVGLYTSLGLAVLTYDKRGNGSSTGRYPGEFPTADALQTYADDASAALSFLAARSDIDPSRVGFHGGSQGGWTVPLAISRHGGAAFAVLVSAPATTVDQTDLWSGFSGGGESKPTQSEAEMLAAVRATHTGYDPMPALRALSVPTLWVLGANDRTVPTKVCVEILAAMNKPNFKVQLVPTGHGMLVNPTGLLSDDNTSVGLAPQLVPTIRMWLGAIA
ncbi:MAG: alpha/beta hydrolase [Chloroflexi bacterium]|nr:MAG: alpha/beta hydrolase [Chloroflexota bacterium]